MTIQTPSLGRIVHYTLSDGDVAVIQKNRLIGDRHGNGVKAGQTYPAMIVRVWTENPTPQDSIQLQVFLDGDDQYWATSRTLGEPGEEGRYIWPPRV